MAGSATDLQGRILTSHGYRRTGMFHQMRDTVGDTACNVNVVLVYGSSAVVCQFFSYHY